MLDYFARLWGFSDSDSDSDFDSGTLKNIKIEGDEKFIRFVQDCLYKIEQHEQFVTVVSMLRMIAEVDSYAEAGMYPDGCFKVNRNTLGLGFWENDFIWGASQIIHDAWHYKRMLEGVFNWSNMVEEELIAFQPQAEFLRDCGRYSQAADISSADGRHQLIRDSEG